MSGRRGKVSVSKEAVSKEAVSKEVQAAPPEADAGPGAEPTAPASALPDARELLHIIGHDLKEPLRGIQFFSQLLKDEYAHRLDADGQEHLTYILGATRRLHLLLDDILALSRLQKHRVYLRTTPLQWLLEDVLQSLEPERSAADVSILIPEPLPQAVVDRELMRIILTQLIRNGIRFRRPDEPHPQLIIRWRRSELALPSMGLPLDSHTLSGTLYVSVEDNGRGIAPEFHTSIFSLFRRLHSWDELEGTGAGLALAQLAAYHMGGSIQVQSSLGNGATFELSMPNRADEPVDETS